ncbi:MAG TPA: hypothetical protein VLQ45_23490 [Thermoanaerobaculia bacterium]|nr:hypothetical protein [Thermoanaerobaculia bacterium]
MDYTVSLWPGSEDLDVARATAAIVELWPEAVLRRGAEWVVSPEPGVKLFIYLNPDSLDPSSEPWVDSVSVEVRGRGEIKVLHGIEAVIRLAQRLHWHALDERGKELTLDRDLICQALALRKAERRRFDGGNLALSLGVLSLVAGLCWLVVRGGHNSGLLLLVACLLAGVSVSILLLPQRKRKTRGGS